MGSEAARRDLHQVIVSLDVERRMGVPVLEPVGPETRITENVPAIDPWGIEAADGALLVEHEHVAYCPPCQGEGQQRCVTCGGSGKMPGSEVVGGVIGAMMICTVCKGTGRTACATCRGTMRVRITPRLRVERASERRGRLVGDVASELPAAAFDALSESPVGHLLAAGEGDAPNTVEGTYRDAAGIWNEARRIADEVERDVLGRGIAARTQ